MELCLDSFDPMFKRHEAVFNERFTSHLAMCEGLESLEIHFKFDYDDHNQVCCLFRDLLEIKDLSTLRVLRASVFFADEEFENHALWLQNEMQRPK
jgi:hypothetical protein